jgi:hypothetical protein
MVTERRRDLFVFALLDFDLFQQLNIFNTTQQLGNLIRQPGARP